MSLEPDLILLGGDLTTCRVEEFDQQSEAFGLLRAPLGVFAVMGNHDYYNDRPDDLRRAVCESGITLLHNSSVELRRGGQVLSLAGVDDLILGQPDLPAALRGTRAPVVLVSHNPDLFFDAARAEVALMLAGHTHAGQIRVPGLSLVYDRILRAQLTLSEAEIELPDLPLAFDGLRLLLITDVHAGPFVSRRTLARTFHRLMELKPDLILLGGDLTTCRVHEYAANLEAFDLLHAPLGVFAVMGNHDYYNKRPETLLRNIEASGIPVLQNRSVELLRNGQSLSLAGVDDLLLGRPDLEAALAGTRPPVVLLSHNPDLFFDAVRADVALMLSGHTHAGQVRLRGFPVLVRQSRYRLDEGRFRTGRTELVVSRGLGAVGVPLRAACPPEAVLLRLRRA